MTTKVYEKPGFCVPLEMRLDSKHRNVGFLALSGRCTVTSLTTTHSHERTLRVGEANDPDAMLAQIRDQTARRVARHRMKKAPAKAGSPPPLRNGDDWSALIRNLDPERRELIRELIKWAHTVPLEAVRRILAEVTGDEVDLLYIPPHLDRRNAA